MRNNKPFGSNEDPQYSDLAIFERSLSALYGHDCKELAQALVTRFGSLSGVLTANAYELETVPGVTKRAAAFIALATPILQQALYRSNCEIDCERGLATEMCIEYYERPYPFRMCVFSDEKGRQVHSELLNGVNDVRNIISGAVRHNVKHYGIIEYIPYNHSFEQKATPLLNDIITNMRLLDMKFIDYLQFDGLKFYSLVRRIHGEPPFDMSGAKTLRYVCDDATLDKILSRD